MRDSDDTGIKMELSWQTEPAEFGDKDVRIVEFDVRLFDQVPRNVGFETPESLAGAIA